MLVKRYTVHVPDHMDAVFASDHYSPAMTEAYRLATEQDPDLKATSAWVIDQYSGLCVYHWSN